LPDNISVLGFANSSVEAPISNEELLSAQVTVADLSAKATSHYAHKNYELAAELYSQAAELQSELNGDLDPRNADTLFLYGRALFKVGQMKSDLLGGGGAKKKKTNGAVKEKKEVMEKSELAKVTEEDEDGAATVAKPNGDAPKTEDDKQPFFQFTGDENFDDDEEEEEAEVCLASNL